MKRFSYFKVPVSSLDLSMQEYLKEISNIPILSKKEEMKLILKMEKGDKEAEQELVKHSLYIVVNIALKHVQEIPSHLMIDVIQEGNIILMKAVKKFDKNYNLNFKRYITFNVYCLLQKVYPIFHYYSTEKINNTLLYKQICEEKNRYFLLYGKYPSTEFLSHKFHLPVMTLQKILCYQEDRQSLNQIVDKQGLQLMDVIEDHSFLSPEKLVIRKCLIEQVKQELNDLTWEQYQIIKLRYGLEDGICKTLMEVSETLGTTFQNIGKKEKSIIYHLSQKMNK